MGSAREGGGQRGHVSRTGSRRFARPPLTAAACDTNTSMPPKKGSVFDKKHEELYGLMSTSVDPSTGRVTTCSCRFCHVFGREEKAGAKRKRTQRPKFYTHFRTDHYVQHLKKQHPQKWSEYGELTTGEERDAFFDSVDVPFACRLESHFERDGAVHFTINESIVKVIIGDLLFHPDDLEGCTHVRALKMFQRSESAAVEGSDGPLTQYKVKINHSKRFSLVVGVVALGASFRLASRTMQLFRDESGIGLYSGCSDMLVADYARVACAVGLQVIYEALCRVTGFSIALDASTHQCMSYLDVRIRFLMHGNINNFHLLAIPLVDRHTGENMFNVVTTFLDALYAQWRGRLVGCATDGAQSMTGRVRGVVSRLAACTTGKFVRIWCGLHQLDLVMQRVFKNSLDESFYSQLTAVIGHLRRQLNLANDMRSTCPKVSDVRWISMHSATKWLTRNIIRVRQHFESKKPQCAPDDVWWTFLFVVNQLASEATLVFVSLQGLRTLLSQQKASLIGLMETYRRLTGMTGPHTDDELAVMDASAVTICGRFALTHDACRTCLDNLDMWVYEALANADDVVAQKIVASAGKMFVEAADGINDIVVERDDDNAPDDYDDVLPMLPHHLVKLNMREFNVLLSAHKPRLKTKLTEAQIHQISQEFVALLRDYREQPDFKAAVDACTDEHVHEFYDAWKVTGGTGSEDTGEVSRFAALQQFCGDLASTFPNTSTVESDFSVIGWEKDEYRTAMTDFSLEGILHCKQFAALKELRASCASD